MNQFGSSHETKIRPHRTYAHESLLVTAEHPGVLLNSIGGSFASRYSRWEDRYTDPRVPFVDFHGNAKL